MKQLHWFYIFISAAPRRHWRCLIFALKPLQKGKPSLTLPGECSKFLQVNTNSGKTERKKLGVISNLKPMRKVLLGGKCPGMSQVIYCDLCPKLKHQVKEMRQNAGICLDFQVHMPAFVNDIYYSATSLYHLCYNQQLSNHIMPAKGTINGIS